MEKDKIMSDLDVLGIVLRAKNFVVLEGEGFDELKKSHLRNDLEKLINTIMKARETKVVEKRMVNHFVNVIEKTLGEPEIEKGRIQKKVFNFKRRVKNA
tara:strand:- start:220 stop:516 length:297 start_codon:yes stop_codon:yes gene_type:complete